MRARYYSDSKVDLPHLWPSYSELPTPPLLPRPTAVAKLTLGQFEEYRKQLLPLVGLMLLTPEELYRASRNKKYQKYFGKLRRLHAAPVRRRKEKVNEANTMARVMRKEMKREDIVARGELSAETLGSNKPAEKLPKSPEQVRRKPRRRRQNDFRDLPRKEAHNDADTVWRDQTSQSSSQVGMEAVKSAERAINQSSRSAHTLPHRLIRGLPHLHLDSASKEPDASAHAKSEKDISSHSSSQDWMETVSIAKDTTDQPLHIMDTLSHGPLPGLQDPPRDDALNESDRTSDDGSRIGSCPKFDDDAQKTLPEFLDEIAKQVEKKPTWSSSEVEQQIGELEDRIRAEKEQTVTTVAQVTAEDKSSDGEQLMTKRAKWRRRKWAARRIQDRLEQPDASLEASETRLGDFKKMSEQYKTESRELDEKLRALRAKKGALREMKRELEAKREETGRKEELKATGSDEGREREPMCTDASRQREAQGCGRAWGLAWRKEEREAPSGVAFERADAVGDLQDHKITATRPFITSDQDEASSAAPAMQDSLTDRLKSHLPQSSITVIDSSLTVDLGAPVPALQNQLLELRDRLRSHYPRFDTLPFDVWTSTNRKTLKTWLKILVSKWQTRFDDVGVAAMGRGRHLQVDKDVKAVINRMVQDHDLNNDTAERMASRWKQAFERRVDDVQRIDWDDMGTEWGWMTDKRDDAVEVSRAETGVQAQASLQGAAFAASSTAMPAQSKPPTSAARYVCSSTQVRHRSTRSRPPVGSDNPPSQTAASDAAPSLPHLTSTGAAHMVSVGAKPHTLRTAIAVGTILFSNPISLSLIRANALKKGDVLSVSRIAGIMATKKCPEVVPLCHPIALTHVGVELRTFDGGEGVGEFGGVAVQVKVQCVGQTGVEMEALTGVMGAALSVVDMCKGVDKGMRVMDVRVVLKKGGRSGTWREGGWVGMANV